MSAHLLANTPPSAAVIKAALEYLLDKKNDKASVYMHNFSGFDGLFLIRALLNMEGIKSSPIVKDGRIIQLKVSFKKRDKKSKSGLLYDCSLTFYDSLLMLPSSLKQLAITFGLPQEKGFFPLKILNNKEYNFDYVGVLPPIENFFHPDPVLQTKEYETFLNEYRELEKEFSDGG
jgi:hypothetical protein